MVEPFLYDELRSLMENILKRFIKSSAMEEATTVKKLMTLSLHENKITYKNVDVGVKASVLLRKSKASDKVKMEFRKDCIIVHGPDQNFVSPRWAKPNGVFLLGIGA